MHIILAIAALIFWAVIQKSLRDQGIDPLSRGQMRYLRRKARKKGVEPWQVDYRPRRGTNPFNVERRADQTSELRVNTEAMDEAGTEPIISANPSNEGGVYQKRSEWPEQIPRGWTPPGYWKQKS